MTRFSIQAKLRALTLVVSAASLLLASGVFFLYDFTSMRLSMAENLHILAGIIGTSSTAAIAFDDPKAATDNLQTLRANPHILRAEIATAKGKTLARYERGVPAAGSPLGRFEFTDELLRLPRPIVLDRRTVGQVTIESDLEVLHARARRYALIVLLALLTSTLFAFLLCTRLVRVVSVPILELAQVARTVSTRRDYSLRVLKRSSDEVGLLVDDFNEMLSQIQLRDTELRHHREHLEEEVAERTAELRNLNQEFLVAKEKAEAATRAKSMFLANMSHEIRTPMNAICGMAELMRHMRLSPQEQTECLARLTQSSGSLLTIINDVLDFSKIEAGKLALEPGNFRLRESLTAAIETLALAADEKGLELGLRVQPEIPDALNGDPGRLRQILVNLVGNAVKFTPKGEVVLSVALESRPGADAVLRFQVRDTGIGIPADRTELIFRPFEQVDSGTTRKFGGTGLGLAIASQLVEMMGGKLSVESEPDKGSTFQFTARFSVDGDAPVASPRPTGELRGKAILLVDDNGTSRQILSEILSSWELKVTVAGGAREALELLEGTAGTERSFPLALVDSAMPGMDGFAFVESLRNRGCLSTAVVLMLPPRGLLQKERHSAGPGIAAYVSKPVRQSDLLAALLKACGAGTEPAAPAATALLEPLGAGRPSRRVLLAEDNPINQHLARLALEKRGHQVVVVEDGREAVDILQRESFDVVLMDLSMPQMDGLEATASIRKQEQGTARHVPILALTAHALRGDKARCLAAGMDGYLSKPLRVAELCAAVEGAGSESPDAASDSRTPRTPGIVLSVDRLLPSFGGDVEILERIASVYLERTPELMDAIRTALLAEDTAALAKAAHRLKGSIVLFDVREATAAVSRLIETAKAADLPGCVKAWEELQVLVESLRQAVVTMLGSRKSSPE